jgi:3D (Asp-Asp-Asp) domain-containing protein
MSTKSSTRHTGRLLSIAVAGGVLILLAPVVLLAGAGNPPCASSLATSAPTTTAESGSWEATAYGPPWGGIQGDGITATGINLSAGRPAYVIAVDPSRISLGSFEHVTPNPFGTSHAFYAGDTGGAIVGQHIDIYDWQGRAAQDAWGKRDVTVTAAPTPGTGNLLNEITPTVADQTATNATGCPSEPTTLTLTPGQTATILPDGQATAPADAPAAVKLAIAAGNALIDKPYIYGGGHGQPLTQLAAGYDCSSSTSYILHAAGLFADYAQTAQQLESYAKSGPGQWITVYANSAHAFIETAGIVMDTAWYTPVKPTSPGSGPRWQPASMIAAQYAGDQADGNGGFVQRHPQGL